MTRSGYKFRRNVPENLDPEEQLCKPCWASAAAAAVKVEGVMRRNDRPEPVANVEISKEVKDYV